MPTIPDATQLGRRVPTARRSMASMDLTQGAQAMEGLGRSLMGAGQVVEQVQEREESERSALERAQAESAWLVSGIESKGKYKDDDNYSDLPKRFSEETKKNRDEIAKSITDPTSRQLFIERTNVDLASGTEWANTRSFELEGDHQTARLGEDLDKIRSSALETEDNEARQRLLENALERIDLHEENGFFGTGGKTKASGMKQKFARDFAQTKVEMENDPDERLKMIKGPLGKMLTPEFKDSVKDAAQTEKKETKAYALAEEWRAKGLGISEMRDKSSKIKDIELRKMVEDRYKYQYALDEKAGKDLQISNYEEYASRIENQDITYADIPVEERNKMTAALRSNLRSLDKSLATNTFAKESDPDVFDKLTGMLARGEQDEARLYFTENSSKLKKEHYYKFSKETQEPTADEKNLLTRLGRISAFFPKQDDKAIKGIKYEMYEWETWFKETNGKPPSDKEYDDTLRSLGQEYDYGFRPGEIWTFDKPVFKTEFASEYMILKTLSETDQAATLSKITEAFSKRHGRDPNPAELLENYQAVVR